MTRRLILSILGFAAFGLPLRAETPAELTDTQMAHVAYVADLIDIRQGHLALALSDNPDVRTFAETMIADHTAVNDQALTLLAKLGVEAEDNYLSQKLQSDANATIARLAALSGADFDKAYAENELAYHKAVNTVVGTDFIPNIENAEVKALFEQGLTIFQGHEAHAEKMVEALK